MRATSIRAGKPPHGEFDAIAGQHAPGLDLGHVGGLGETAEHFARLFAGGRVPAKVFVFDTESGKQIAELDCVSGIDDLWYDAARKRIYATGTDGIAVYDQKDPDHYTMVKVASAPGAATSIWVPTLNRLFVSAPKVGDSDGAILVYEAPR